MEEFLIFTLFGPVVSWGDIAVGEYRPSFSHPSKSAVLGLVAGSLGIERNDDKAHQRLEKSLGFGLRVESIGKLLRDYHTVQVPASPKAIHSTRRSEIQDEKKETILSQRDYRTDAYVEAALWIKGKAEYSLGNIAEALKNPFYAPFLGRKSCSPALPFDPLIIKVNSLKDAFNKYHEERNIPVNLWEKLKNSMLDNNLKRKSVSFHWDEGVNSGLIATKQVRRKDSILSRKKWQFLDRVELSGSED